jgi:hypothetical protein
MNTRGLTIATIVGLILQVAMVVIGHSNPSVKNLFAVGGMGFSLVAGIIYGTSAGTRSAGSLALGGAVAGGICAFVGILVSYLLGDVPPTLLALGTVSSIVTGAIGGTIAKLFAPRPAISL